jgi:N-acetylglucosamine malate deacetylase 2
VPRLLCIGAHPDDESFFAAGTIAKYTSQRVEVTIVCATRGERGATADLCSIEELPQVREQELRDAMRILGVSDVRFLPYEDQKLQQAPIEDVRFALVEIIRETRPDVVFTFDPHGTNQHVDHIAIARFASDALSAAADPRWYPQSGPPHTPWRVLWPPPIIIFRQPPEADLRAQPGIDFLIDTSEFAEQKTAALKAHRTQFPGLKKLFFDDPNGQRTFNWEAFRIGWGARPASIPANDLFAE